MAIAVMIFATALIAAGRLLAVSVDARSDARSVVGMSSQSRGMILVSLPDSGVAVPLQVAALSDDDDVLSDTTAAISAAHAAFPPSSGSLADFTSDQLFTGSIHSFTARFEALELAKAEHIKIPTKIQDRPAIAHVPVPRVRTQLASLPPADDIGIQQDLDIPTAKTAIYDITSQTVYMPNGEKLEAHSGLGQYMDKPKYVHLKMRGATPPNTYKLRLRESLFHGVQAIRMLPLRENEMFRRNGILAHSYMLGPTGQSNGCISFKNYPKFLSAFMRGEVDHITVVARLAKPPSFYARRNIKSANAL
ncbi:uncharacterized protein DUF2778 [Pseudorhodoplanes sinuspersici]|uniref:Uncharacterized protein n=2 Tax=Pseudorhodoplanes sinuspersici TaxID=1235591 RepID=A0A1W6ZU26_9HYPH|nr:hypothetical protein CAK95_15195 [Pseudorhodoplanes sinuspersici]RKE67580.1 uncharacterized protein DUF2778 [Pseudorhodoplanes sinuspersici]